ncbi:sterol desaturase family protein [Gemmatimonas sp.]|jgi:sterol desaturase/sphingolipid hydroxylase (fatty acid hydroxylase superfamily)|uniref:sterol desaturase family protein n=1 Tax=Gemmatimonas sp. TaxID=1962908 RepID=UPI0037C187CD
MGIIQASIPLFFLFIAAELLFAQLGRRPFYRLNDSISDLSAGTISQVAGVFTKVLLLAVYAWTFDQLRVQRWLDLPEWPGGRWRTAEGALHAPVIVAWCAAFVLVDFAYYWFHRLSHEVNIFWAGHVVHHSSEEYNLAVALRQSAVGGVLSWIFYVPLAVLGMPWEHFAVCYALNLVYQFWIHTRVVHRLPAWCEAVLNTPSHHRVHHGVNPEYQDRNYAGVFIVWDRWFGTYTPERQEPVYGLTTPLRSWNPLWAQVHQYVAIARNVWHARSWRDRWQYLFGSPAWRPAEQGGPVVLPEVSRDTFTPFDPQVPRALSWYALAQFALIVPVALWFLASAARLPVGQLIAGAFYLALSLTNVGGVLEARRWAFASEQARLGALAVAGVVLLTRGALMPGLGLALLCVGSLAALWTRRHAFTAMSDERMDFHHA